MSSAIKPVADIPTISKLYGAGKLKPSTEEDLPSPNQQLNNKVCTYKGDITKLQCDAIVNAANSGLRGGGGVDGAIQSAAGPDLLRECRTLGGCETGSAKITDAYDLPCKKVIHAVGPVFDSIKESEPLLKGAYRTSLQLAVENECKTIAFPAISTGVYGYPSGAAARAAVREVYTFLRKPEGQKLDKVVFCNFLDKDVDAYAKYLPTIFPPTKEDLSHTGEFEEPEENEAQNEGMPIREQKPLKEIYEPGQAPKWGLTTGPADPYHSSAESNPPSDIDASRSPPGSLKRSLEGEDCAVHKKRREVSSADTLVGEDGHIQDIIPKEAESDLDAVEVRSIRSDASGDAASSI
ncbi:hypothetical protein H2200_010085 [Cladophialophora chaetospira]|uniref:Macro domain-containing protein n=1 Tax=Cladophialophora chaetospira TaxID=386627 RepID=A0AA38X2B2_9EURO|nr:hypothetical protein H2200_010085 [Cladophialophora chaetospira]